MGHGRYAMSPYRRVGAGRRANCARLCPPERRRRRGTAGSDENENSTFERRSAGVAVGGAARAARARRRVRAQPAPSRGSDTLLMQYTVHTHSREHGEAVPQVPLPLDCTTHATCTQQSTPTTIHVTSALHRQPTAHTHWLRPRSGASPPLSHSLRTPLSDPVPHTCTCTQQQSTPTTSTLHVAARST